MIRMQFNNFILTTYEVLMMNHSVAEINNFLIACIYHLFNIRSIETNCRFLSRLKVIVKI